MESTTGIKCALVDRLKCLNSLWLIKCECIPPIHFFKLDKLYIWNPPCAIVGSDITIIQVIIKVRVFQERKLNDNSLFSKSTFKGKALILIRNLKNLESLLNLSTDSLG